MFCSGCGNEVAAGERFCRVCGKEVSAAAADTTGVIVPAQTSGKAIASLVCGLFLFAFPLSVLAVIFGHLSLSEIRKSAGQLKGEGLAMAGLVLGYVGAAAIPIILIIAAIAIPNLMRARIAANEASAAASVHVLIVAEIGYLTAHPEAGYSCSLSELSGLGLIDAGLASGQKSGYVFELLNCTAGASAKFQAVAYPAVRNQTGTRAFCAVDDGVVRVEPSGTVTAATGYTNCLGLTPLNN